MTAQNQAAAQYESIVAMLAAVEVDFDRLEELTDLSRKPRFVAGWNLPGYMPDSEPATFDDIDDAIAYVVDQMLEEVDVVVFVGHATEACDLLEQVDCIQHGEPSAFSTTVHGMAYWVAQDGTMLDEEGPDAVEELAELEEQAGEYESFDDVEEAINNNALSIEFRSGWGDDKEGMTAEEYRVVLCTGGPHVELQGDLNRYGEPESVRVLYKGWGESGELYSFNRDAVMAYVSRIIG